MSTTPNWEDAYRVQTARVEELRRENVALRELVEHWYKLVPDNIRSAIKDAQEEGQT